MLRCAVGFLSIASLEQVPVSIVNAHAQIPDWTSIRRQLEDRTREINRKAKRIHTGDD
jgi:hypothetical protein